MVADITFYQRNARCRIPRLRLQQLCRIGARQRQLQPPPSIALRAVFHALRVSRATFGGRPPGSRLPCCRGLEQTAKCTPTNTLPSEKTPFAPPYESTSPVAISHAAVHLCGEGGVAAAPGKSMMRRLVDGAYVPLITAGLVAVIVLAQGLTLWRSYWATWSLASVSAENVLNTVAANIERNLSIIDLSVRGAVDAFGADGVRDLAPELRRSVLFDRAASARYLGQLVILDRNGDIVEASGSLQPPKTNLADRDYFTAQTNGQSGLYVSAPFRSRLRDNDPSIALSRRISGPDGSFEGVVLAALRLAFFQSLLDTVNLGTESAIAITRTDGTIILRSPATDGTGNSGLNVAASPVFQRMIARASEPFSQRSQLDGINRYYLHTMIGEFPLLLSVGISPDAAMAEWTESALISSALTVAMCVLLIVVVRALRLALMRSQEVEAQLKILAVTDELTGVPNRRAFDLALGSEIRRAARNRLSLAVLLIDVDHFKRINDRFGHAVGDVALARIAREISRCIRRPGDFAARYGGEEFVVILPATEAGGASFLAERMRLTIASMEPCPGEPSLGKVTVSIGVAAALVHPSSSGAELVTWADRALYEAKGAGRNRVAFYREDELANAMPGSHTLSGG